MVADYGYLGRDSTPLLIANGERSGVVFAAAVAVTCGGGPHAACLLARWIDALRCQETTSRTDGEPSRVRNHFVRVEPTGRLRSQRSGRKDHLNNWLCREDDQGCLGGQRTRLSCSRPSSHGVDGATRCSGAQHLLSRHRSAHTVSALDGAQVWLTPCRVW